MSVTSASGFSVGVSEAGIRESGGPDLVLIASDRPASAAATFTTNLMRAAPVLLAEEALTSGAATVRGIVINAGCANAGTGAAGLKDARAVVAAAACRSSDATPVRIGAVDGGLDQRR